MIMAVIAKPLFDIHPALRLFLRLQKNNNLTTDLLEKGTPKISETNPTPRLLLRPKPETPQPLATTAAPPAMEPKFPKIAAHEDVRRAQFSFFKQRLWPSVRQQKTRSPRDDAHKINLRKSLTI